ncbi:PREDICTED: olfactory receptor 1009-like [Gekko japonicus]|uniref:Olfactory receptor 1009-like n=1 Tax=Gekko japonicus TaxID=146911 RepID=A0ABM1K3E0_GEKJA|nr:PREDICTED: olfactory receptor 1009-like [Gekko japonicus]
MGDDNFTTTTEFILVGLSSDRKTQILLFVLVLLMYIFTLLGNLGVIVLVRVDSHLHTPMYFFLSHLSSVEIGFITSTVPQMLNHLLTGRGELSLVRCALQMYMTLALGSVEAILLGIMAYDRYLAVCHPLVYASAMGKWRQFQLASACWLAGFIIAAICVSITFQHPFCGSCCIDHFVCEIPMVLKLACNDARVTRHIIVMFAGIVILGPFSVILTSYGHILFSVLQMRSAAGLRKAFFTCSSHLIVVTLFYGTIIFVYIRPQSGTSPENEKQMAVFYLMVTPLLNPLIYTLRNKDVHVAMAKARETAAEFLAELRQLSADCNFGEHLEDALRDHFVRTHSGAPSPRLPKRGPLSPNLRPRKPRRHLYRPLRRSGLPRPQHSNPDAQQGYKSKSSSDPPRSRWFQKSSVRVTNTFSIRWPER